MIPACAAKTVIGDELVACQIDESTPHEWHEAVTDGDTNVFWKES